MPVCAVCSGTEFFCESGFYYCSECQTQTQDIREELHDQDGGDYEGNTVGRKRKRRSSVLPKAPRIVEENMTSWEGYNFALSGLVNELITLGVNSEFKKIVLQLWTGYLAKLEVAFISKTEPAIPKLGPNYKHYDAEIIYGYSEKKEKQKEEFEKKRKIKEPEKDDDDLLSNDTDNEDEDNATRKKNLKRKRAAIQLNYEKTLHEMSLASQTLTDVTLEMLSSSKLTEEVEEEIEKQSYQYNEAGEIFKDKAHIQYMHPGVLSRKKLLAILYLGLLITKDKLKLSDLLRWIWEGHVSFNYLFKLLPPDVKYVGDTAQTFGTYFPPSPYNIVLHQAQQLGHFLGVKAVKAPSLNDMIEHYTAELNLPAQISLLAQRLLAILPKPQNSAAVTIRDKIPNWEGIAMAHIIVALKILFGLDDCTENRNSNVARRMNKLIKSQGESVKLFVWEDWVYFCTLRKTALTLLHDRSCLEQELPTSAVQNINPILSSWDRKFGNSNQVLSSTSKNALLKQSHKQIVSRILDKYPEYESNENPIVFPPSLSPLSEYTEAIIRACENNQLGVDSSGEWGTAVRQLNLNMLGEKFSTTVIDYLTHPESYVKWAQQRGLCVGLHNGSGVSSIKYSELEDKRTTREKKVFYRVKVLLDKVEGLPTPALPSKATVQNRSFSCHKPIIYPKIEDKDPHGPFPDIAEMKDSVFTKTKSKAKKAGGHSKVVKSTYDNLPKEDEDKVLYTPHSEYWMLHWPEAFYDPLFSERKRELPASFLFLLEECASLLEMPMSLLYKEVTDLEVIQKDFSLFEKENKLGMSTYNLEQYGKESSIKDFKAFW